MIFQRINKIVREIVYLCRIRNRNVRKESLHLECQMTSESESEVPESLHVDVCRRKGRLSSRLHTQLWLLKVHRANR